MTAVGVLPFSDLFAGVLRMMGNIEAFAFLRLLVPVIFIVVLEDRLTMLKPCLPLLGNGGLSISIVMIARAGRTGSSICLIDKGEENK